MTYLPSNDVIDHFIWRKTYFVEDNATPLFHYKMVDHYFKDDSYIKPIKAFRGSAKSTNTCYVALHRAESIDSHYTLIISDTATQAEALVSDISDMLRESVLPYTVIRDVAGEIELMVSGKRYFIVAKGAGASMRGIKRARKRPDLIILDDIVNDQLVMNRLRIDRLNRWFYKALLPSLDPEGEIYAVGTPLSQNDLFMHLCSLHSTIEIPLTDDAWPDRFSPEWIARKRAEYSDAGMLQAFKQEFELVLTDSETQVFDIQKIKTCDQEDVPTGLTYYLTLDGAFSEKESADYSAFAVLGIDPMGRWYVFPHYLRSRPNDVIDRLFQLTGEFGVDKVGIEKGAFLLSMEYDVQQKMAEYQQFFQVVPLATTGSKLSRIKALAPLISQGLLTIVDTGEAAELLMEQLQLTSNDGVMASHDDHLDAMAQLLQLRPIWMESSEYTREDYMPKPVSSNYF